MKLENQVTNLELSKRLKELGVKQESLFKWTIEYQKKTGESSTQLMGGYYGIHVGHNISWRVYDWKKREEFSAFTVAELGEMLPPSYFTARTNKLWLAFNNAIVISRAIQEKTEADARAKILIHLIENKLLAPKLSSKS